jgi:hypothetical protein
MKIWVLVGKNQECELVTLMSMLGCLKAKTWNSVLLCLHCNVNNCDYNKPIYCKQENVIPSYSSIIRNGLSHRSIKFPKNLRTTSNFYTPHVRYEASSKLGPASITRTCKKLIRRGNISPMLYLPLYKTTRKSVNFPAKRYWSAPQHTSVTYVKPVGSAALSPYEWRQKLHAWKQTHGKLVSK